MTGLLDTNVALYLLGGPACPTTSHWELWHLGNYRNGAARLAAAYDRRRKEGSRVSWELMICELTPSIRARAVQLRREQHLKLPDDIVCATAMEFGVELWTNDTTLVRVSGLSCRRVNLVR
jgi:predicted nucleic acid-binding protein